MWFLAELVKVFDARYYRLMNSQVSLVHRQPAGRISVVGTSSTMWQRFVKSMNWFGILLSMQYILYVYILPICSSICACTAYVNRNRRVPIECRKWDPIAHDSCWSSSSSIWHANLSGSRRQVRDRSVTVNRFNICPLERISLSDWYGLPFAIENTVAIEEWTRWSSWWLQYRYVNPVTHSFVLIRNSIEVKLGCHQRRIIVAHCHVDNTHTLDLTTNARGCMWWWWWWLG